MLTPFKSYTKINKNCTFTVRVTVSPVTSLSIGDATEMTPPSLEILNRPFAVESVKQCGRKQHCTEDMGTTVAITSDGGEYNLRWCRL